MTITNINASEEQSQYVGQVYQKYYARLRHYFLTQLGNASEAEDCVQQTIRHLFFFMEDRCWEAEAEYISVYLMRIAGLLCATKLAEKRSQSLNSLDDNENNSAFDKVRIAASRVIKERIEFMRNFLAPAEGNGSALSKVQ